MSVGEYSGETDIQQGKRRIVVGYFFIGALTRLVFAAGQLSQGSPEGWVDLTAGLMSVVLLGVLRLKPGWFDRQLPWRRHDPAHTDRTILICPSPEFIAGLPNAKVPDRTDFVNFSTEERIRMWKTVVDQCQVLADELNSVLDKDQLAARLQPL